jgi:cytochrome b6-f complex iron-sulfur subunit
MATARVLTAKSESHSDDIRPSRREFLSYIWGASIALAFGGASAGLAWYMLPRENPKEVYTFTYGLPPRGSTARVPQAHMNEWNRRFIMSHTDDDSLIALHRLCTHEHCFVKWVPLNHRYECPCHGAKFELDGTYIEGPAPRHLDRFLITVTFADGSTETTNEAGDPIALTDREVVHVTVDTRRLIEGAPRN